jgi:hypothetical protein
VNLRVPIGFGPNNKQLIGEFSSWKSQPQKLPHFKGVYRRFFQSGRQQAFDCLVHARAGGNWTLGAAAAAANRCERKEKQQTPAVQMSNQ